jgi:hypothetical protein
MFPVYFPLNQVAIWRTRRVENLMVAQLSNDLPPREREGAFPFSQKPAPKPV